MVNVPLKGSEEKIVGEFVEPGVIRILNTNGYLINEIHYNPEYMEGLARDIANLITDARDIGFTQGQRHVRVALGFTK